MLPLLLPDAVLGHVPWWLVVLLLEVRLAVEGGILGTWLVWRWLQSDETNEED